MAPLITLLSDFGLTDAYVGIMKGVIMAIAPHSPIIDLTHDLPPQDLWAARFNLLNAIPYFSDGTLHVAVVDPGVGGDRRGVAIQLPHCTLVGPDNGIFSGVFTPYLNGLDNDDGVQAIALTNPRYWRTPEPSTTFHGRDIFAPVAAHLAQGILLKDMGATIDPRSLKRLDLPVVQCLENKRVGCIQYGDRFGNLITNISGKTVQDRPWWVEIAGQHLMGQKTYGNVDTGEPVALVGSHSWIEIAVNGGSARDMFGIDIGSSVSIVIDP